MLKKLNLILENISARKIIGNINIKINSIQSNSLLIKENDLFIALKGTKLDGHIFIEKSIKKGAKAIICENLPQILDKNVSYILVENSLKILPKIVKNFFENPSKNLKLIGITGTNGKTSIATLLYNLFKNLGYKVGLISTIENKIIDEIYNAKLTTPDIISLNELLSKMVEKNCEYCFMEISSHGIHQKRIEDLHFSGGIFTNLTHDHLDYHSNFKEYLNVKKSFFDKYLLKDAFAISNIDDKNGNVILQNTKAKKITYALKNHADFKAKIIERHFDSTFININHQEVWLHLIGDFNIYNLLAVYTCAIHLGESQENVLKEMSNLKSVNGRFETLYSEDKKIMAIVDYAHTPDALKNVLQTINNIKNNNQNIITVFGAGGDRDKSKRSKMGKIASDLSHQIIITSDNPRTENPEEIISDIEKGVSEEINYIKINNREEAIKTAVLLSKKDDIILVAGKGHETYQEINGVKHHFDDKEIIKNFFIKKIA